MAQQSSTKKRLPLAAFVSGAIGLLGMMFIFSIVYLNNSFNSSIANILSRETTSYTNVMTGVIINTVERNLLIASSLAETLVIDAGGKPDSEPVQDFLKAKINFELDEVFFLSAPDKVVFSSAKDSSVISKPEFLEALASAYGTKTARALILQSDVYQAQILYVISPIIDKEQSWAVVVGKVLDNNYLATLAPDASRGFFLLNEIGHVKGSTGYDKDILNPLLVTFITKDILASNSVALSKIYNTDRFAGGIVLTTLNYNGFPLGLFGFYVDGTDLFNIQKLLYTINLYILIGLLTMFVFTILILKKLVIDPITAIDNGLVKLSDGDFDVGMKVVGLKEIAEIASGFNFTVSHLKKLNDAKTGFISVASHQLRTPLTSMRWFSEMLLAGDAGEINEQQQAFVQRIYEGTSRMVDLVNLLLQIARVEAGRVRIVPKPLDLRTTTEEVVQTLKTLIDAKSQKVEFKVNPEPFPPIPLDKEVVWQVIQNLMTNANRYSPKDSTILVTIIQKGKEVEYSVKDQGIGIPEDQRNRIFEKFFRAENALRSVPEGSGLGLNLVKLLVEGWNGKVWFETETGKGTTFFFTIPMEGMKAKAGDVGIEVTVR
ncbi:MAG TPA: HAMP domain-containing sensor histidine kinase [Patescibacteria group bacterium]|jgi:signal transduction histidine kinase|nr:HAMP domain-containing sensor histidine kinase [Patescibacteria group bacterium]